MNTKYPKTSKELKQRLSGKGLRNVNEGKILREGLKGLLRELFKIKKIAQ